MKYSRNKFTEKVVRPLLNECGLDVGVNTLQKGVRAKAFNEKWTKEQIDSKLRDVVIPHLKKHHGAHNIQHHEISPKSSKLSGYSLNLPGLNEDYHIVISVVDRGNTFEKWHKRECNAFNDDQKHNTVHVKAFSNGIARLHPNLGAITSFTDRDRKASTLRSFDTSLDETGRIIADQFANTDDGQEIPISLKIDNGKCICSYGANGVFRHDYSTNTNSKAYPLLKIFLDVLRKNGVSNPEEIIAKGFASYKKGSKAKRNDVEVNMKVNQRSALFSFIIGMFGIDYSLMKYVSKKGVPYWYGININEEVLRRILKDVVLTTICFPRPNCKSFKAIFENDLVRFTISFRSKGGGVRPDGVMLDITRENFLEPLY